MVCVDSAEYTSIKVTKVLKRQLHAFKAGIMAREKRQVSDGDAIAQALLDSKRFAARLELTQDSPSVWDLAGSITGGKKFNAVTEIEKVVYGV